MMTTAKMVVVMRAFVSVCLATASACALTSDGANAAFQDTDTVASASTSMSTSATDGSISLRSALAFGMTFIFMIGVSWLLYPAWVVFVAPRVEWRVDILGSDDYDDKNDNDDRSNGDDDGDGPRYSSSHPVLPTPTLSLVIPAYNEEERIHVMLEQAHQYLVSDRGQQLLGRLKIDPDRTERTSTNRILGTTVVEWIIVNDGSNDSTCHVVQETYKRLSSNSQTLQKQHHAWKIVNLSQNSGKGAAVKTGMNLSQGRYRLMVDADGATDFGPGLESLVDQMLSSISSSKLTTSSSFQHIKSNNDDDDVGLVAVFGSRAHLQEEKNTNAARRSFLRTLLMHGFHFFVSCLVSTRIKDTQCGFKLFTAQSSERIFQTLHLRRWAFDTEIVLSCDQQSIQIIERPVPWHEVDGSKLSTSKFALAWVSLTMLRDMICVRTCYTVGIWRPASNSMNTTKKSVNGRENPFNVKNE